MEKSGQQIRECLHNHDLRSLDSAMVQDGPHPQPLPAVEMSASKPIPVRSSARVSKKAKLDLATKNGKDEKIKSPNGPSNSAIAGEGKRKRNWGLWSVEDKNTFFEALNEHGKDFDAIQSHFASKIKKKGVTEAKNKDQVRHFYYRNWHKISKFINFNPDLGKMNQELFGLINYGELRKRLGRSVLDKNVILKLHELIYDGTTQIKVKGKTVRVKTPSCRALRRLGQIDKVEDAPKLPARVTVELRPVNNRTWGVVHSKAHNPRVSSSLSLQHKFSTLITVLQTRWQSRDAKILEKLAAAGEASVPTPRQTMRLRLAPKAGAKISVPALNVNETTTTNTAISLKSLEDRLISIRKASGSKAGKGGCSKSRSKKKNVDGDKPGDTHGTASTEKILALQLEGEDATDGDLKKSPKETDHEDLVVEEKKVDSYGEQLESIKAGWTLENSSNLTLGELYVMFGSDSKLCFEYSWEEIPPIAAVNGVDRINAFSSVMKRLVNLARILPVLKEKSSCPCGHICTKGVAKGQGRQRAPKPKSAPTAPAASMVTPQELPTNGMMLQATAVVIPNAHQQPATVTIQSQPLPNQDGLFRRPLIAPSQSKIQGSAEEEAFKAQLEQFRPKKYCNRPGRTNRKNLVVQRTPPMALLPKAPDRLVLMTTNRPRAVSFTHGPGGIIVPVIAPQPSTSPKSVMPKATTSKAQQPIQPQAQVAIGNATATVVPAAFNTKAPSSPPTITSLLGLHPEDLSLGSESATLKDVTLGNSGPPSFVGLLGQSQPQVPESNLLQPAEISPPLSPTQILKEDDNQWLNSEVSDFSLSSFLGHLESPMKSSVNGTNLDDSRLSQDVDVPFQCLMSENSLEYMTSFADLAAHITTDTPGKK